jgi:hypothetical protein
MTNPFRVSATVSRIDVFFERQPLARRFGQHAREIGATLWLWASLVGFVGVIFAAATFVGHSLSRGVVVALIYGLGALAGLVGVITAALALVRTFGRSATDALVPRRIGFHAAGIEVESGSGVVTQERYVWLAGASRSSSFIELSLAHDRPLFVRITKSSIGAEPFAMLCSWLEEHRVIDRGR